MKTKKLIELLNEADPSGEEEVCVGNIDILFVSKDPAYYDGCLQVLIRDPLQEPYYNITGAKITGVGSKIQIHTLDIESAIYNASDLSVDLEGASGRYTEEVKCWRKDAKDLEEELKNEKTN